MFARFRDEVAKPGSTLSIVIGALALAAGFYALTFGFALAGAGHGWTIPFRVSLGAPFIGAVAWLVWFKRYCWWSLYLGLALLGVELVANVYLLTETLKEKSYFVKLWNMGADVVMLWCTVWMYPQALLLSTLAFQIRRVIRR